MPFVPDKTSFVPESSFIPDEGPSLGGAAKQFLIGAANSAAFSLPELAAKETFDSLASEHTAERIARGAGTTVGAVVGLPGLAFKTGAKIATKGIGKVAPKLINQGKGGIGKAMVEGAGGAGLFNAVDPNVPLEEKPQAIATGIAGGAFVGAGLHALPRAVQKAFQKNKSVSEKTKSAINEATRPPTLYDAQGRPLNEGVKGIPPSLDRQLPRQAKGVIESLEKSQTELEAAKRGIISSKDQVALSRNINPREIFDKWQPGQAVNTEALYAVRIDLAKRGLALGQSPSREAIEKFSADVIKARGMVGETGRALGSLSRPQSMAAEELRLLTDSFAKLDPEVKGAAQELFKQFQAPGFWDKFMEFRTASLLTSPFTQIRNTVGNTIPRVFAPFEKTFAGAANRAESFLTKKKQTVFMREGLADVVGVYQGFKPAMRKAIESLMNENFVANERIFEAVRHAQAIPGLKGKIVRLPFRALGAMDAFFSTLGTHASLYSQATRQALFEGVKNVPARVAELVKNPSPGMIEKAAKDALVDTFRQPGGPAFQNLQKALNAQNPFSRGVKFIVPFFRTPVNLFKWTAKRAPGSSIPFNWKALAKGSPEQRAEAVGRLAFGQIVSAGIVLQAMEGNLTGRLSTKKEERDTLQRLGQQPYSIKIGDKFISYRSYEPISSWLGMIANAVEVSKEKKDMDKSKAAEIVFETIKMTKDQSFLRGVSDLFNAIDDPERFGERFIQNATTSLVPTGVAYLARLQDPVLREPQSIPDAFRTKLPGLSKKVAPKLDVWGRPITKEGTLMQRALLPSGVTTLKPDLTENELLSVEEFPRKVNERYRGVKLTVEERNFVTRYEGRLAKPYLDALVRTPEYQRMTPEQQAQSIEKILSAVRKAGRIAFTNKKRIEALRGAKTQEEKIELYEKFTNKILVKR